MNTSRLPTSYCTDENVSKQRNCFHRGKQMNFSRDIWIMITNNEKYSLPPRCLVIVSLIFSLLVPSVAVCSEGVHGSPTIPNFNRVESWLYRGARPDAEGVRMLRSIGIRTIVTLERGWFEKEPPEVQKERQLAEQAGIQFIHVPLHPFFNPRSDEIRKVLSIVMDTALHPVFIHCRKGKDRTGIIIAVFRVRHQNWAVQPAYEELESFGHRSILLFWWKNVLPEDAYDNFRNIGSIGGSCLFKTCWDRRTPRLRFMDKISHSQVFFHFAKWSCYCDEPVRWRNIEE